MVGPRPNNMSILYASSRAAIEQTFVWHMVVNVLCESTARRLRLAGTAGYCVAHPKNLCASMWSVNEAFITVKVNSH